MAYALWKRQAFSTANGDDGDDPQYEADDDGYYGGVSWWWTPAGIATRYSIVGALFAAILLFFVGGYFHAKRRMRKGLPLLSYHRWMVRQPAYNYPPPRNVQYAQYGDPNSHYPMEGYPPPPPAYHTEEASMPPPTYQPPPGGTKAMADQDFRETNRGAEASGSGGPNAVHPTQH